MCYRLSPYEVVRVNCEMYCDSDDAVNDAWQDPGMRMPFHGFSESSVSDVRLRRFFTANVLNYMYLYIQELLDMTLVDTNLEDFASYRDGVYLRRVDLSGRIFDVIKKFRAYNPSTFRASAYYLKMTAKINEYPGPWIFSVKVELCVLREGRECLVDSVYDS
jgi:hypothetical protein